MLGVMSGENEKKRTDIAWGRGGFKLRGGRLD